MKAKKKSGSTKGKASGKRAVKDLPAHKAQSVKGGAWGVPVIPSAAPVRPSFEDISLLNQPGKSTY